MNTLFGLIPVLPALAIIWWLVYASILTKKSAFGLSLFALFITTLLSLQTYGPRNELATSTMPPVPEAVAVEGGSKLVDPKDRIGQFDERLKQ